MPAEQPKLRVLLLVRSLGRGGAEGQLTILARGLLAAGHDVCVAVYYPVGPYLTELTAAGVRVVSLRKRGRWDIVPFLWRLQRLARQMQPDVLYGYMPSENLACLLLARLSRTRALVVWGIRASHVHGIYGLLPRAVRTLQRWLARAPDLVISNSHAGLQALGLGEQDRHSVVIPNGIDTVRFRISAELRRAGRTMLNVRDDETVVGLVGRLDPMKGHDCFLRAAALVARERRAVRFVIVGSGPPPYRQSLLGLAAELGIGERLIWLESIAQVEAVYNALDLLTVASKFGEGFPNVIAEAMACGIGVVATDVGDTARVIGPHGIVIEPNAPRELAAAVSRALDGGTEAAPTARRAWIVEHFGIPAMLNATESALTQICASRRE